MESERVESGEKTTPQTLKFAQKNPRTCYWVVDLSCLVPREVVPCRSLVPYDACHADPPMHGQQGHAKLTIRL
eukprot:s3249_g7.t1